MANLWESKNIRQKFTGDIICVKRENDTNFVIFWTKKTISHIYDDSDYTSPGIKVQKSRI